MNNLTIKQFTLGHLKSNSYVITDSESVGVVIDAGENPDQLIEYISNFKVEYIFLTHSHYDHISGINLLKNYTDASVVIHHTEAEWLVDPNLNHSIKTKSPIVSEWPDILIHGDEVVKCGSLTIKAFHTPGHSPGSTCYLINNQYIFTGDTLLSGLIGPTDLPNSNRNLLKNSIRNKLFTLNEDIIVYPGHGQTTTIGFEKKITHYQT
jgi:hydroxyacylglutathione hydrolase